MSVEQIIGLALALLVMLCGSAASVLPGIPGTPVVLLVAIGHRLYFGTAGANNWVLAILILLTLLSVLFDYLASMFGAKKIPLTWGGYAQFMEVPARWALPDETGLRPTELATLPLAVVTAHARHDCSSKRGQTIIHFRMIWCTTCCWLT